MNIDKEINTALGAILATSLRVNGELASPILLSYANIVKMQNSSELEKLLESNRVAALPSIMEGEYKQGEGFKVSEEYKIEGSLSLDTTASNSILVIPVNGIMMRESSFSFYEGYITGTRELESIIKQAAKLDNISAIVINLKSPGGEAAGNESLAKAIKAAKSVKPVLVSFEGMASAALEAFIGATEIYAVEKGSYFGSLGTMTSVSDTSSYYESMGIKNTVIYAPQSSEKNKEVRSVLEGDFKPMEDRLGKTTDFFIKDVKNARPSIIDDGKFFKGAIYNAVEALNMKAIDGIKDFDFVINRAAFLSKKDARNNQSKNMKTDDLGANVQADENEISKEDKTFLSQLRAMFKGSEKTATLEEQNNTKLSGEVEQLKANLATNGNIIKDLEATKEQLETKVAALQTNIEALELDAKALTEAKTVEGQQPFKSFSELVTAFNEVFEHNKELGGKGAAPSLPVAQKESTDVLEKTVQNYKNKSLVQIEAEIEKKLKKEA